MAGCYAFSTFQTARLLRPGEWSITPSLSRQALVDDGDADDLWSALEVQARRGISRRLEAGLKLGRIGLADGYQFASAGPKVAIVPERLAFLLPVGLFFGSDQQTGESFQVHPTLLGSVPLDRAVELEVAAKRLVFLGGVSDDVWAASVGLEAGRPADPVTLHPEIGVLRTAGGGGWLLQWGLGLVVPLGRL
ncbi:MAG: hypothetical protein AB1505_02655 [Candidatus Latescibacterota bacterium]